tara:strand:+ start:1002 stop:1937 length:936 start_codon:yes stop_codon:yes gene_type:complete
MPLELNMFLNQIIKIIIAGIFTFSIIGSLSIVSNSIFLEKVIDEVENVSKVKFNKMREEFFETQSSINKNKKILTHTVVKREDLLDKIKEQEDRLNELLFFTSPEAASEYLNKLNSKLKQAEHALYHSVVGREKLIEKIGIIKSEISSFKEIMPSTDSLPSSVIDNQEIKPVTETIEIPVTETIEIIEKPKLSFEEELALASVETGQKLSKKCTACHSLKSGGPNGVGPTLWNIVNAPKANIDNYSYSSALLSIGGSWTVQDLNMWLKSPKKYAPGNKMSFAGLRKIKDRADLIAFLNSISDKPISNNGLN